MQHPVLPLLLIGALAIGTVALLLMDRASSGQHAWSPGAAFRAPVGDPTTVTRHVWRPDASEDTIRVDVLVRRIAEEALAESKRGRHRLPEDPAAERQGDERGGQLHTHYPLLTHPVAA